jgi:hypothetical protein
MLSPSRQGSSKGPSLHPGKLQRRPESRHDFASSWDGIRGLRNDIPRTRRSIQRSATTSPDSIATSAHPGMASGNPRRHPGNPPLDPGICDDVSGFHCDFGSSRDGIRASAVASREPTARFRDLRRCLRIPPRFRLIPGRHPAIRGDIPGTHRSIQGSAATFPDLGATSARGEKKGSGRRNVTAPEFGLKEVGSLFYIYSCRWAPFFDTLAKESLRKFAPGPRRHPKAYRRRHEASRRHPLTDGGDLRPGNLEAELSVDIHGELS